MKTPLSHSNRPGLGALRYRIGTYGDFRQSMLARLADPAEPFRPLNMLRTRGPDDPAIALIDAFAAVGEVLSFYQERLANEGFLGTATEPRSLQELARLTDYRPRQGVAASVMLSYTLDPNAAVTIPVGSRAQSVPGPGQIAQSYETGQDLSATGAWSAMRPRLSRPTQAGGPLDQLMAAGTSTGLRANDPVLLVVAGAPQLRRVDAVKADFARQRTVIDLHPLPKVTAATPGQPPPSPPPLLPQDPSAAVTAVALKLAVLAQRAPSGPPIRSLPDADLFAPQAESTLALVSGITPAQRAAVFRSLAQAELAPRPPLKVFSFRAHTAPFGNRAPPKLEVDSQGRVLPPQDWTLLTYGPPVPFSIAVSVDTFHPDGTRASPAVRVSFADAFIEFGVTDGRSHTLGKFGTVKATVILPVTQATPTPSVETMPTPSVDIQFEFEFSQEPPLVLVIAVHKFGGAPAAAAANLEPSGDAVVTLKPSDGLLAFVVDGTLQRRISNVFTEIADENVLFLDGSFATITPGSWVAFDVPAPAAPALCKVCKVVACNDISRTAYGQTARTTRLVLDKAWIDPPNTTFDRAIRQTSIYCDSQELTLADEDMPDMLTAGDPTLELDGLYPGLKPGRSVVVSGERHDMPGVTAAELVTLAAVEHAGETTPGSGGLLAGETPHTVLSFAAPLAYPYVRETVRVLGNVVTATQGESCNDVLGSGDGSKANQSFMLKKPPLTYVLAATPSGVASTLQVWVNGIAWQEVEALVAQGAQDRVFITATSADGSVTVRFGDGVHGARLPTGIENVRARYRSGIGPDANVGAGTITTLLSRPLGVTAVSNPAAAIGGAGPDDPEAIRQSIPKGLVALDRLVSLRDYEDFTQHFAGIGKAVARRFAGPDGPLVHVTLAGVDDGALDPDGPSWKVLADALERFGDPLQEVELAPRAARVAVVAAAVAVATGRLWSDVGPAVRATLLDGFGFGARSLGQSLYASEILAAIQTVPGVDHVELTLLAGVPQPCTLDTLQGAIAAGGARDLIARPARVDRSSARRPRFILPAELVYLSGQLPDMLRLIEAPP